MAFTDLTNFNPYKGESEASWRRHQSNQAALKQISTTFQNVMEANRIRREKAAAQNRAFRDRELGVVNQTVDQLIQEQPSGSKITDTQLQQTGQQIKSEFFDAVKAYNASDKGDEARAAFEQAKSTALSSARTINGAIDKLSTKTEELRGLIQSDQVSPATNANVRSFLTDLLDPSTPPDKYQITKDPESGALKYIDSETGGKEVSFFLDDIANGESDFKIIQKADLPKILSDLTRDAAQKTKQVATEWGVAEMPDYDLIQQNLYDGLDKMWANDDLFRAMAAEEGYDWAIINAIENGEEPVDSEGNPILDTAGNPIIDMESLKTEMKQDLFAKVFDSIPINTQALYVSPGHENPLADQDPVAQRQAQDQREQQLNANQVLITAATKKDVEGLKNSLLGRVDGIDDLTIDGNKLILYSFLSGGKTKPEYIFDLTKTGDLQRLAELGGGDRDLAQRADSFKSQL